MDCRYELLLASAARLYSLGVDLEDARTRLSRFVEGGVSFSSPEMEQAYREFQQFDAQWKELEKEHLSLREEFHRDSVQRLMDELQKGWDSAKQEGWMTLEKVETALLSDQPNEETVSALQESVQITADPTVKGYRDMDELFSALKSEPAAPSGDIQAWTEAAQSLFGSIPNDVTLEQAKEEHLGKI